MKKFRKIMAILVAAVMIVATMVPAWAASGRFDTADGAITISTTVSGETYKIYKIFDLASFSDDDPDSNKHSTDKYAYVLETGTAWENFFKEASKDSSYEAWGSDFITVDWDKEITIGSKTYHPVEGIVVTTGGFAEEQTSGQNDPEKDFGVDALYSHSSQKFARSAAKYAEATSGVTIAKANITGDGTAKGWGTLPLGYYIVTSSLGTLVALDTTNKSVTMYEKNVAPTITKTTQENSKLSGGAANDGKTGYGSSNDANIGEKVYFKNVITVGKGDKNYKVHDKMSAGLTFNNDVAVYLVKDYSAGSTTPSTGALVPIKGIVPEAEGHVAAAFGTADTDNYSVVSPGSELENADKCSFEITFTEAFLNSVDNLITKATHEEGEYSLVILYSARLNENAVIGGAGNTNEFKLNYGETQSVTKTTTTYTWALDLRKYWTNRSNTVEGLGDAQFQVMRGTSTDALKFVEIARGVYKYVADAQTTVFDKKETSANKLSDNTTAKTSSEFRDYYYGTVGGVANQTLVDKLETDATGYINILGLDGDEYVVSEYLAPRGFYKLKDKIYVHIEGVTSEGYTKTGGDALTDGQVIIKADGETTTKTGDLAADTTIPATQAGDAKNPDERMVNVENKTSAELPSTGGMGTTVLYIVGGMLVILAGAYLFFSRKKTA